MAPPKRQKFMIFLLVVLVIPFCFAMLRLTGGFSGGRFGIVKVLGDSMEWPKNGSFVLSLPLTPRVGDVVIAWGNLPGSDSRDQRKTLMVKEFQGSSLQSTAIDQEVKEFEIRSKVVAGWRPWWAKGADRTIPSRLIPLEPQNPDSEFLRVEREMTPVSHGSHGVMPYDNNANFKTVTCYHKVHSFPSVNFINICWTGKGTAWVVFGNTRTTLKPTEKDEVRGIVLHSTVPASCVKIGTNGQTRTRYVLTAYR